MNHDVSVFGRFFSCEAVSTMAVVDEEASAGVSVDSTGVAYSVSAGAASTSSSCSSFASSSTAFDFSSTGALRKLMTFGLTVKMSPGLSRVLAFRI